MNKPEILAPAGSVGAMEAAIKACADAVYMGGSMFGARAYADNPGQDELVEAIRYVHFYDKKLYLTLNTLLKEEEMDLVGDYLLPYYKAGLDGIIIQDPGVFSFIKRNFPGLPLHASTQMNITGVAAAKLLKEMGASRIVPARELSLSEISRIKRETGLEIETFVHGALCYCYSGRCLMSSVIGGRSGNRGRCAQPCRLPYEVERGKKSSYVLSPKDLCTVSILPELVEAGIDSFKIEGRMKNPEYVASIVSVYRKYLDFYLKNPDKPYEVAEEDNKLLLEAYNRGGFTKGYYHQHNGGDMMSMERPNHRGISVGKIEKIQDGQIYFHPTVEIHKGDVLELPIPGGENLPITSPADCKPGKSFSLKARQVKRLKTGKEILRTANPWQKKQLSDEILTPVKKRKIVGKAEFFIGQPAKLTLWIQEKRMKHEPKTEDDFREEHSSKKYTQNEGKPQVSEQESIQISIQGETVLKADERPLTKEQIRKPLLQTGTSRFKFENLDIEVEEGAFLPMGALKKLRREGLDQLQTCLEDSQRRTWDLGHFIPWEKENTKINQKGKPGFQPEFLASAEDKEKLMFLISRPEIDGLYVPIEEVTGEERRELVKKADEFQKSLYYALPRVFRNKEQDEYDTLYEEFLKEKPAGFLIRNIDELAWIREKESGRAEEDNQETYSPRIILDHSLYAYNREARWSLENILLSSEKTDRMDLDSIRITLPLELNKKELHDLIDSSIDMEQEFILYGRIPLMVSAQCVSKNTKACEKKSGYLKMTDRYQKPFFTRRHCRHCYNTIWNGVPLSFHGMKTEISRLQPVSLRLHFTVEKEEEMDRIIRLFYEEWNRDGVSSVKMQGEFTRGHYKRGVE